MDTKQRLIGSFGRVAQFIGALILLSMGMAKVHGQASMPVPLSSRPSVNALSAVGQIPFFFVDMKKEYLPKVDVGFSKYRSTDLHQKKLVYLTFDDGPDINSTPFILDAIEEFEAASNQRVQVTFFIIASRVTAETLPILFRMIDRGDIIALHGINHKNSSSLSETVYRNNMALGLHLIWSIYDQYNQQRGLTDTNKVSPPGWYYRFPYGNYGKAVNC